LNTLQIQAANYQHILAEFTNRFPEMLGAKHEVIAKTSELVNFVRLGYLLSYWTATGTSVIKVIRLVFLNYL
jgi:hypothetical protein